MLQTPARQRTTTATPTHGNVRRERASPQEQHNSTYPGRTSASSSFSMSLQDTTTKTTCSSASAPAVPPDAAPAAAPPPPPPPVPRPEGRSPSCTLASDPTPSNSFKNVDKMRLPMLPPDVVDPSSAPLSSINHQLPTVRSPHARHTTHDIHTQTHKYTYLRWASVSKLSKYKIHGEALRARWKIDRIRASVSPKYFDKRSAPVTSTKFMCIYIQYVEKNHHVSRSEGARMDDDPSTCGSLTSFAMTRTR